MSAPFHLLHGYGRLIRSQLPIPGAVAIDTSAAVDQQPALEIMLHPAAAQAAASGPVCHRTAAGLDYAIPALGRFACTKGRLEITPEPGADLARLQAVVVATMLPTLLWIGGAFVLHAAAVALPGSGRLIALAGPSGSGKSTLAAQLLAHGGRLAGDDSLCLELLAGSVSAQGLPGGQYLQMGTGQRQFVPAASAKTCAGGPLAAVIVLDRGGHQDGLQRLSALAATEAMLANRHRPQVPDMLGMAGPVLAACAAIAAAVPIYRWQRGECQAPPGLAELALLQSLA